MAHAAKPWYDNQKKQWTRIPQEMNVTEETRATVHKQIDRLVYDLYGLTDEEIQIVESAAR